MTTLLKVANSRLNSFKLYHIAVPEVPKKTNLWKLSIIFEKLITQKCVWSLDTYRHMKDTCWTPGYDLDDLV